MYEQLKLQHQLCFKHYVLSKEIIRKYKPLLDPLGLTYTGYITMLALWEKDDVSIKDLSTRLYLDSGTLTPLLKKLEKQGYIKRKRFKEDERIVHITVTKKGIQLQEEAKDIPFKLAKRLFKEGALDKKTLLEHKATLDKMLEQFE